MRFIRILSDNTTFNDSNVETGSTKIDQPISTEVSEALTSDASLDNGRYLNIHVLIKTNLINSKSCVTIKI